MNSVPAPPPDLIEVVVTNLEISTMRCDDVWAIRRKLREAGIPLEPGASLRCSSGTLYTVTTHSSLIYRWVPPL